MSEPINIPSLQKNLVIARLPLSIDLPMSQIDRLRKTVSAIAGGDNDLFHNHKDRKRVIFRYPLVQYKSLHGRGAILGIDQQGCEALENLQQHPDFMAIFNQNGITQLEKETFNLSMNDQMQYEYKLQNWLPLNDQNYQKFLQMHSLVERITFLDSCLTGHILKFCSSIRWLLPPRSLQVAINDLRLVPGKNLHLNHFNILFHARFRTNITLPEGIGLGKAVSHGFGVVLRIN